jgi:hypothetical protein
MEPQMNGRLRRKAKGKRQRAKGKNEGAGIINSLKLSI